MKMYRLNLILVFMYVLISSKLFYETVYTEQLNRYDPQFPITE